MISKGFKDRVKNSLYNEYQIQCKRFITVSDTSYHINAQDKLGQELFIALDISNAINGYSVSPQFSVCIDGVDVINKKLFMVDKIQSALNKSVDALKEIESTKISSLTLKSRINDYVLLMGGCSQSSSYLNATYTIPYSPLNGFILYGNNELHTIADISARRSETIFKPSEKQTHIAHSLHLSDFYFDLKVDEQTLLDDYILRMTVAHDIELHCYEIRDMETINFLKSLNPDLISHKNIDYIKDFYTVINMVKV